ncbi:MAG: hypothetical protein KGO96_10680 [Elusimicrobia bacterium]|nr:hypothetical protein [Elusimicrobiota bacterium]
MFSLALKKSKGLEQYLARTAKKLNGSSTLRVGFLEGAKYPNGTPVALVAAVQNFGAPSRGIPPRPFFSSMVRERQSEWPDRIEQALKATDSDANKALQQVGHSIVADLKQSIMDTNEPRLKQATIDRKGFEKPLIDTGVLISSVDFEVS